MFLLYCLRRECEEWVAPLILGFCPVLSWPGMPRLVPPGSVPSVSAAKERGKGNNLRPGEQGGAGRAGHFGGQGWGRPHCWRAFFVRLRYFLFYFRLVRDPFLVSAGLLCHGVCGVMRHNAVKLRYFATAAQQTNG